MLDMATGNVFVPQTASLSTEQWVVFWSSVRFL